MFAYSKFVYQGQDTFFPYERPLSDDYRVTVQGEDIPVYTCQISKFPFNRIWPGHQRPVDQAETASFIRLVGDEAITLDIRMLLPHSTLRLKPYSKKIPLTETADGVRFTLEKPGFFVLEGDSYHHCLYIFYSKPIPAPEPEDVTYYFGPGIHFPGKITLNSNESLYIDRDALVYGCVFAENAENIRIFGNGLLDDSHEERTGNQCYDRYINGNMKFYDCHGVTVEGVGMTNSALWCFNLFGCSEVLLDGIQIFGQWRYNTDGIDIVNSQRVTVRHSFVHSFDDTIVIKGVDSHCHLDNRDILVEDCVLWCDWGRCCELGIETACREYSHITFRDCDILRGGCIALDISNGDCAEIHHVTFRDIRVEFNAFDTPEVYQATDDMVYSATDQMALPSLLLLRNFPFRTAENMKAWGIPPLDERLDLTGVRSRFTHHVTVDNIQVYYDEGLPLADGKPIIRMDVTNEPGTPPCEDISISNIFVNGQPFSN